jgi:hypothetical protein
LFGFFSERHRKIRCRQGCRRHAQRRKLHVRSACAGVYGEFRPS